MSQEQSEKHHWDREHDLPPPKPPKRGTGEYLGLAARGVAMGACDVVPGVSGGTMAFILGIYEELINSLRTLGRPAFFRPLFRLQLKEAAQAINLPFLVAVFSGILVAVGILTRVMTWLLESAPTITWSFFFGLILASVIVIARKIHSWSPTLVIALVGAAVGAFFLVGLVPAQTPEGDWFIFLSGMLAICAMILPGISGALILVILGKYQFISGKVSAITSGDAGTSDFVTLGVFAAGCVVGLITFAQLLGWLFRRFHNLTVVILTGLMIGSLRKVWPWKETLETMLDRHGESMPIRQENFIPPLGEEALLGLLFALIGFGAVLLVERIAGNDESERV